MISSLARSRVRAYAQSNMTDEVTISRPPTGDYAMDPATLEVAAPLSETLYSGIARCHLSAPTGTATTGEGQISQHQSSVSIPYDAPAVRVGDLVLIDTQADPQMVGTLWRIIGVSGSGAFAAFRELSVNAWAPSDEWTSS